MGAFSRLEEGALRAPGLHGPSRPAKQDRVSLSARPAPAYPKGGLGFRVSGLGFRASGLGFLFRV